MSCALTNGEGCGGVTSMNDCNKRKYPYDTPFAKKYYKDDDSTDGLSAALYYPYNTEVLQPKWPDGLASYSEGVKRFYNKEIKFPSDIVVAVITPGATNFVTLYKFISVPGSGGYVEIFDYGDLMKNLNLKLHKDIYIVQETMNYASWRPVSYALHIWSTSGETKNDGYFDCIRIPGTKLDSKMLIRTTEDITRNAQVGNVSMRPETITENYLNYPYNKFNRRMTGHPSYYVGTMSELNEYVFQLNPQKKENDFLDLKPVVTPDAVGGVFVLPNEAIQTLAAGKKGRSVPGNRDSLVSDSHDVIIIRLFGKADETKLLFQGAANMELIPNENSVKHTAVTPNTPAPETLSRYIENRGKFHKLPFHLSKTTFGVKTSSSAVKRF